MSVVIIGGHDRMACQYKRICKEYKCKAKVFTQMSGNLKEKIGSPDLVVLFRGRKNPGKGSKVPYQQRKCVSGNFNGKMPGESCFIKKIISFSLYKNFPICLY